MTLKMLIVDDEPIICRGLASTIPWEEYNIEVVNTAYDGEDAINKVKEINGVDLVITDVKMPKVDGLQLSGYISENHPETQIIMISGYDDFKYAQKALQLGVKNYLLKPVDIEELLKVIEKVTHDINKAQLELQNLQQLSLRNVIYRQVFDFDYPVAVAEEIEMTETVRVYPFISMLKSYVSITSPMEEEELRNRKLQWEKLVEKPIEEAGYTSISIFISENILLTCMIINNYNHVFANDLLSKVEELTEHYLIILNDSSILLSDLSQTISMFNEKINNLPLKNDRDIIGSNIEKSKMVTRSYPEKIEENLINSIVQFNTSKIEEYTTQLFIHFQTHQYKLEETITVCRKVIKHLINRFRSLSQKNSNSIHLYFTQSIDVLLNDSYGMMQKLFTQDLERIISYFDLKELDHKDWLMERALVYIRSYYKSNIKVQEVAGVINISPSYFSTLFKQKTGKNFNEYINEMRVEEAKSLLAETPFKVSEISEQVGFHEYKYFVEVFKKFSGITPTKYRKFQSIK